jgi:beta-glucanase (GH16 family)
MGEGSTYTKCSLVVAAAMFVFASLAASATAATPTCKSISGGVRCEAEIFNLDDPGGAAVVRAKRSRVSGGKVLLLKRNGSASLTADLPRITTFTVRARGARSCRRGPRLLVSVDGKPVLERKVRARWKSYRVAVRLAAAFHAIAITNQSRKATCHRNLRIDYIDFGASRTASEAGKRKQPKQQPAPEPTPVPTPTPVPEPTPVPTPGTPQPFLSSPGSQTWNLVFDDEFDAALLNATVWHTCFWWSTLTCSIPSNNELELYNPADVYLAGGNLRMRAQRRDMVGWNGQTYHYTSGLAMTGGRKYEKPPGFTFTYGFAEARVKLPKGKGFWPTFWLLPAAYNSRPEVDILEARGSNTNRANFNVHFAGVDTGGSYTGADFSADYHTFAVDWQPTVLVFYVDGIERWRYTGSGIPNEAEYLVLNLAVGGDYDGSPDASTPFPSYFDVDYARVWQRG